MLGLQVPAQDQNKQEEANLAGAVSPGTGRQGPQISPQRAKRRRTRRRSMEVCCKSTTKFRDWQCWGGKGRLREV